MINAQIKIRRTESVCKSSMFIFILRTDNVLSHKNLPMTSWAQLQPPPLSVFPGEAACPFPWLLRLVAEP